jgi:hypothetical protein
MRKTTFPKPDICEECDPNGEQEVKSGSSAESSNSDPGRGKDEEVVSSGKKIKLEN